MKKKPKKNNQKPILIKYVGENFSVVVEEENGKIVEFSVFPLSGQKGTRIIEDSNGKVRKEGVRFDNIFGWYSEKELFALRQKYPRTAP